MHSRITELLGYIESERAKLRAVVETIPASHRAVAPASGRWSVLEILDHLRIVEGRIAGMFAKRLEEARAANLPPETDEASVLAAFQIDKVLNRGKRLQAPAPLHPTVPVDAEAAFAALAETRTKFVEVVRSADGVSLAQVSAPHPFFGDLNLYEWIAFVGAHEARHADQIREVGASLSGAA